MIPIPDGAVLREILDRYHKQDRYKVIPDFIVSLLDDHLNYLRQKEFDIEVARGEMNARLKDLRKRVKKV
jgi:hypothetical protein